MNSPSRRIYRLDGIEIDTSQVCLKRDGQELHLRQKTFQVLIYLLEKRDRLVTKDELIEHLWQGAAVTDNTLEQCLAEIRKVLGDDSRHPRFVKTVPRAGYRFIGSVEESDSGEERATAIKGVTAREAEQEAKSPGDVTASVTDGFALPAMKPRWLIARRSISLFIVAIMIAAATTFYFVQRRSLPGPRVTLPQEAGKTPVVVMFFDNESASADLDWLREGLADMIITDLSRSKNLIVLSRQQLQVLLGRAGHPASDKIQLDEALDVARKSQAKIVILGSFARLGEQIRIDVQLHDARDGQLLAAERLVVGQPAQILTQVDLLSLKLASHLGVPAEREANAGLTSVMTDNLEAYRYYSLAVEKAQALQNAEAIALLQKAISLDPQFAMAYARVGYAYGVTGFEPEKAKTYLQKGFQLSHRLTEKDKLYIAAWYAIANLDYAAHDSLGLAYQWAGRYPEAIAEYERALALKPDFGIPSVHLGNTYFQQGRYQEALRQYQSYFRSASSDNYRARAWHSISVVYWNEGKLTETERAAKEEMRYNKKEVGDLLLIALRRSDRAAAEKFEQILEAIRSDQRFDTGLMRQLFFYRGYFDFKTARGPEAVENFREALKHRPVIWDIDPLEDCLANAYLELGRVDEAIAEYERILKLNPNYPLVHYHLAQAYERKGQQDQARASYQRFLQIWKDADTDIPQVISAKRALAGQS